ncbi:ATP-grasp domain-containing protein [Streptomyces sp. NBC_00576]|uniref:ATP-grasp domain-containing protein n=1 Tax=Streptomyces sp. NBC_00576 TaxID=2903665 RepID=UPI002E821820|nr:ATP-grasp domain-containing protein [Streptomyces sp. NBC_00576]WUB71993.1 ATP-grasp domain-containing protein [Streptomyces sp. NBC_00576]
MTTNAPVVIVDPYAPARGFPAAFREAGHPVVRVQSTPEPPAVYRGSLDLSEYADNLVYGGDFDAFAQTVRELGPVAVITGSEIGVEFADALSEALGLPSNGTELSHARRDKYAMIEKIKECGVAGARQLLVTSESELRTWHESVGGTIVLKPLRSAAGDGVSFCDSPDESAAAYKVLADRPTVFSEPAAGVVAQEYLVGTEYIVNTVSCAGRHYATDVWQTERISVNGVTDLLVETYLLPAEDQVVQELVAYGFRVLDALGVRHGPGHLEIKRTPHGPRLVEMGARISGGELPYQAQRAIGEGQLECTVDAYVRPASFAARTGRNYHVKHAIGWAGLASPHAGRLVGYRDLQGIRELPSVRDVRIMVQPGQQIKETVDDLTYPVTVMLEHDVHDVLLRDLNTIRYLDGPSMYEVEPGSRPTFHAPGA